MNWRDIRRGMTVYHTIFTHFGPGIVEGIVTCDGLERLFERGNRRVLVLWDKSDKASRMQLREIRKTPNKKKIRTMVEIYQRRGVDAKDGGDKLILPKNLGK